MIAPPSFDTLKIAQDLKHAGFTEQQAEALTDAIKATLTAIVGGAQCLLIYLGLQRVIEWNS